MDKEKVFWIVGFAVIAAASLIIMHLQTPREPVILTFQEEAVAVTEEISAGTDITETTTAAISVTETAETLTTAPPVPQNRNLNTAAAEDLQRVSGIGAVLAAEILAYRDQLGGFTRRAQLMEISGIGEVLMERIMEEFEIPDELPPAEEITEQPESEPEPEPDPEPEPEPQPSGPYNVNTVTREELLTIPDMTEALADSILAMRERLGGYRGIYELVHAEPDALYFEEVLRDWLYVEGDPLSRQPDE